jgi:hypothetical protein
MVLIDVQHHDLRKARMIWRNRIDMQLAESCRKVSLPCRGKGLTVEHKDLMLQQCILEQPYGLAVKIACKVDAIDRHADLWTEGDERNAAGAVLVYSAKAFMAASSP